MGRLLRVCGCVLAGLAVFGPVARAFALEPGWPFETSAPTIVSYGASYISSDGGSSVHSGIDVAVSAGTSVLGVLEGKVTFAGRVPAGEGATTIAVTVESGDVRLTYMPLSETPLSAGETVGAGQRLGSLAAAGDRSHPEPHLHLSARRGTLYIDPSQFLVPPAAVASSGEVEVVPATPLVQQAPAATAPAAAPLAAEAEPELHGVKQQQPLVQTRPSSVSDARVAAGSGVASAEPQGVAAPHEGAAAPSHLPAAQGSPGFVDAGALAASVPPAAAVLPDRARAALTTDRRALATGSVVPQGALVALAGAAGVALLWPVWRATPVPAASRALKRQDVAAVIAR
ncbi:MAG: M23 family metallopeptidase [Coriobacteriia bacterium]|nr:M23 family metallopeptidase [Coriobacteriia bacterium]